LTLDFPLCVSFCTIRVLKKGQEAGYSLRHILTEALLALESAAENEQAVLTTLSEMTDRLAQVQSALERFQHLNLSSTQRQDEKLDQAALADSFVLSVKSAAKPGLTLDI